MQDKLMVKKIISFEDVWGFVKAKIIMLGTLAGSIAAIAVVYNMTPKFLTEGAAAESHAEIGQDIQVAQAYNEEQRTRMKQSAKQHLIVSYTIAIDGLDDRITRTRAEHSRTPPTAQELAYLQSLITKREQYQRELEIVLRSND